MNPKHSRMERELSTQFSTFKQGGTSGGVRRRSYDGEVESGGR